MHMIFIQSCWFHCVMLHPFSGVASPQVFLHLCCCWGADLVCLPSNLLCGLVHVWSEAGGRWGLKAFHLQNHFKEMWKNCHKIVPVSVEVTSFHAVFLLDALPSSNTDLICYICILYVWRWLNSGTEKRNGLFWCYKHKDWEPSKCSQVDLASQFFDKVYAKVLLLKPTKVRQGTVRQ